MRRREPRSTEDHGAERKRLVAVCVSTVVVFSWLYVMCGAGEAPPSVDQQKRRMQHLDQQVEPFHRNLSECARRTRASQSDVEHFLRRMPPRTPQGKCLTACLLRRLGIMRANKIDLQALMDANRQVYQDDPETLSLVREAGELCSSKAELIFEACEAASMFNECMHVRLEHALHRAAVEKRMRALGQLTDDDEAAISEQDIDDALVAALRDEL